MNFFYTLLSAALHAVCFPAPAWWWFSFIALVPFFLSLERSGTLARRLGLGLLWGAAVVATNGYWLFIPLVSHYGIAVHSAVLFVVLFVLVPVCGLFLLFSAAFHFLFKPTATFHALVIPALWVLFIDFSKTRLSFLLPWGDIGYALIPFTSYVQIADLGGVYSVSFLIVMINGLLCYLLSPIFPGKTGVNISRNAPRKFSRIVAMAVLLSALFFPIVYGHFRISALDAEISAKSGEGVETVIVQGNHSLSDRWSGMGFDNRLRTYLTLSQTATPANGRIIVWPETVLNMPSRTDDRFFMEMMRWIGKDSLLVAGGLYEDRQTAGGVYNSAYFISGQGRLSRYDKQILLPYAEAVPPIDLLGRYYSAPDHFSRGRTPVCIQTPLGGIGTSICLEILYPRFIRNGVKSGGNVLVNLSNDGWFGRSPMPYLHLAAARMRAIENRRFLLRAANSGISALIGPDGRILRKTDLFEQKCITGRFIKIDEQTIYTRFGEWVVYLSAGLILVFALVRLAIGKAD